MIKVEKEAFEAAFREYKDHMKPEYESYLNGWIDSLEHRDKTPSPTSLQLFDALQDCMWHGSKDWDDWLYQKVRAAIEAAKPTQSGDYQTPDNER